jgi:TetR/AcrR family transcriptional regulator, mexJK operon transcriptional repressor
VSEAPKRRPGRPSPPQAPEDETRALIMRAASDLFWERGYAAVSVADIAAAVGITKPTLYYHFGGKDAVYVAVMRHTMELIAAAIREIGRTPLPIRERLHLLAHGFLANAPTEANHDAMMRDVEQHLPPTARDEMARFHSAMMTAYADLMRDAIARGELRPLDPLWLAHTFQHLLDGIVLKRNAALFADHRAAAEAVIDLFLLGAARDSPADGG